MKKIQYKVFKAKQKINLKVDTKGNYEENPKEFSSFIFGDKKEDNLKIWLTKLGRSECDSVNLSTYNPVGNIEDIMFSFYHFDYTNDKHYRISLEYTKENKKIFDRLFTKKENKSYWKIKVCELDGKEGKEIALCEERKFNTQESLEIEAILSNKTEGIKIRIFKLIKTFKYNRIKLKYEQKNILEEIKNREEEKINGFSNQNTVYSNGSL